MLLRGAESFTVLDPGLQCFLSHGLLDNKEHQASQKNKKQKQSESTNIKVTKRLARIQKFNRSILLSPPPPLQHPHRIKESYSYSDWIEYGSIQVLSIREGEREREKVGLNMPVFSI